MKFVSKGIIVNKNKYLLQLRDVKKNIAYPNSWGFFGGAFKKHETAESCIARELYEELLINSEIISKIYEGYHTTTKSYIHFFSILPRDKITINNLREGQNLGWFEKKEIEKMQIAGDVKIFVNFLN